IFLLFPISLGIAQEKGEEKTKKQTFLNRLSIGIGYSGGICCTGKYLQPYSSEMIPPPPIYWLNSIEGSIKFLLKERKKIEVGIGYGWAGLNDRDGWGSSFQLPDSTKGYVGGGNDVYIHRIRIFAEDMHKPNVGFEIGYTRLKTIERLSYHRPNQNRITIDKRVIRHCIGGGMYLFFKKLLKRQDGTPIWVIYGGGKYAWDFEIFNNSPFKWTKAEKKVNVNFSGVYIGIKRIFGGVK
ncbi:MAG: hypothetical protein NC833_06300, partial [Candidatus Omnitrophica bacterium]|nr:hypothetical protein [Candidatus Omnitrophota bacterium]